MGLCTIPPLFDKYCGLENRACIRRLPLLECQRTPADTTAIKGNCLSGALGAETECYKDGDNDGAQEKRE